MKGSWIRFDYVDVSKSGKTKLWRIRPLDSHDTLGEVKWYGPWRKYCFYPDHNTVFEQDCLRDIAKFCESQTKAHREK